MLSENETNVNAWWCVYSTKYIAYRQVVGSIFFTKQIYPVKKSFACILVNAGFCQNFKMRFNNFFNYRCLRRNCITFVTSITTRLFTGVNEVQNLRGYRLKILLITFVPSLVKRTPLIFLARLAVVICKEQTDQDYELTFSETTPKTELQSNQIPRQPN